MAHSTCSLRGFTCLHPSGHGRSVHEREPPTSVCDLPALLYEQKQRRGHEAEVAYQNYTHRSVVAFAFVYGRVGGHHNLHRCGQTLREAVVIAMGSKEGKAKQAATSWQTLVASSPQRTQHCKIIDHSLHVPRTRPQDQSLSSPSRAAALGISVQTVILLVVHL